MWQLGLIVFGLPGIIAASVITAATAGIAIAAANSGSSSSSNDSSSSDSPSKEETLRNMKANEEKKAKLNEQQQMRRKIKEDFSTRLREINSHFDLDLPDNLNFIDIKQYCDNPDVLIDLYMVDFECKSEDVDDEQKELEELKQLLTYTQGNNFKAS